MQVAPRRDRGNARICWGRAHLDELVELLLAEARLAHVDLPLEHHCARAAVASRITVHVFA